MRFHVIGEPNPPEAIIQSERLTRWVEVVDAFWSKEWARDQYSFGTPGEEHVAIARGPYVNPDLRFAQSFIESLSKKLAKSSSLPVAKQYGPGYLVVNVDYPLFDRCAHHATKGIVGEGSAMAEQRLLQRSVPANSNVWPLWISAVGCVAL